MSLLLLFNQNIPLYDYLLNSSDNFSMNKQYREANIFSHMSAELAVEAILLDEINKLNYGLRNWLLNYIGTNHNLAKNNIKKLYIALTSDHIPTTFSKWESFIESNKVRNKVIHKGYDPNSEESEASIQAVKLLITHIGNLPLPS